MFTIFEVINVYRHIHVSYPHIWHRMILLNRLLQILSYDVVTSRFFFQNYKPIYYVCIFIFKSISDK